MLGSPASPRKRPFELLSDLVDDGGFGEDLHPERWDVSALDEMARYTKLGLGVAGELAGSEEAVLMGRWGRSHDEGAEEEMGEEKRSNSASVPSANHVVQDTAAGREDGHMSVATTTEQDQCVAGGLAEGGQDGGMSKEHTVEVYQVGQQEEEEEEVAAASLALEHCSEEHNYSLGQGGDLVPGPCVQTEENNEDAQREIQEREESPVHLDDEEQQDEEEEEEEEGTEETAVEAELSSSSESDCGELCFHSF